jgi:hypothetical protein
VVVLQLEKELLVTDFFFFELVLDEAELLLLVVLG